TGPYRMLTRENVVDVVVFPVGPAEADGPGVPVVCDAGAIDQIIGLRERIAHVDAIRDGPAHGKPGEGDLRIPIVLPAFTRRGAGERGGGGDGRFTLEAPGRTTTYNEAHAIEVMREGACDREVLRVLARIIVESGPCAIDRIASVFRIVRGEGGGEMEAGERRAEVDDFRRIGVDAIAGSVRRAVPDHAGVREVEIRRVGAEDARGARHQVAELGESLGGVAETEFAVAAAEV